MTKARTKQRGFTLIELMVAVAIIGIVAAIAIPTYRDYISTAEVAVLVQNMDTMRVFQEDFRLRRGAYAAGTWNSGTDAWEPATAADASFDWVPNDNGDTTYVITTTATAYTVTATDGSTGRTEARTYP